MHLNNFVNLPAEEIDYKQQAAFRSHKGTRRFPSAFLGVNRVADLGIVECLTPSSVVQGYKLTGHEVVFYFEKSDVLFATAYERGLGCWIEFETGHVEVSQLSR